MVEAVSETCLRRQNDLNSLERFPRRVVASGEDWRLSSQIEVLKFSPKSPNQIHNPNPSSQIGTLIYTQPTHAEIEGGKKGDSVGRERLLRRRRRWVEEPTRERHTKRVRASSKRERDTVGGSSAAVLTTAVQRRSRRRRRVSPPLFLGCSATTVRRASIAAGVSPSAAATAIGPISPFYFQLHCPFSFMIYYPV
ncbi:hypothetical protein PIB30_055618 [Stylosanthes scabra]|uniref:Uncharacterized protein n=1 Tax=Stylosanthes scabra TaxID=79078 RepID=A0ABU6ZHT7_9FABA|nr:hypothetical protein [Stylosanthes scabra]